MVEHQYLTQFNAAIAHYGLIGPILISAVILPDFRSSLISLCLQDCQEGEEEGAESNERRDQD